jgi:hypothetical protein
MPTPIEAYRQGYERGRSDSAGGRLAEVTMGMLRDDPGGHFQKGYSDGAAGRPFSPPASPATKRPTDGLIPKFSENPMGWFLAVCIVVECWVLWQLIKAPFQLVGALAHSQRPSAPVVVKNVVILVAIVVLVWSNKTGTLDRRQQYANPTAPAVSAVAAPPTPTAPSAPPAVSPLTAPPEPSKLLGKWYWKGTEDYYDFRGNGTCLANSDTLDQRGWDPQVKSCDVNTLGYVKLSFESEPMTFAIVSFSSSEMHIAQNVTYGPEPHLVRDERVLIRK